MSTSDMRCCEFNGPNNVGMLCLFVTKVVPLDGLLVVY